MNSPPDELNSDSISPRGDAGQEVSGSDVPLLAATGTPDALLFALREQLQELRQRFERTEAQLAGYLRDQAGTNRGSAGNGEAMAHVQQSLDRLLARFDQIVPLVSSVKPVSESSGQQEVLEAIRKLGDFQNQLAGKIVNALGKRLAEELDLLRFQQIVHETLTTEWDRREAEAKRNAEQETLAVAESDAEIELAEVKVETPAAPERDPSSDAWSRAIWGPELVASQGFAAFLGELNRRLLAGDAGASNLAGQLLVFRQSPSEAKPQLLKDVGEAYYRTRLDKGNPDHPLEEALIGWLQAECERAGLPNTIEVVHAGERFDKSRHSSTTRGGAEVSEVFGWIVLTEGGRVYTRASVAAQ